MDIKQEVIDDLNAVISITVSPEDYQGKVKTILSDYQGKANLPGFRKGHVPIGMVKKMYGSSVMADEINKLLNENLNSYISEEKLQILGNPIPNIDEQPKESLNDGETFEFKYDIGLSPKFEIKIDNKIKANYHSINIDDELLGKYTKDLTRRYGSTKEVDVVGENNLVNGKIDELDSNGEKVENGIHNHASIGLEYLENEKAKKALIGKKLEESLEINPRDYTKNNAELAAMLGIDKDKVDSIGKKFRLTIAKIHDLTEYNTSLGYTDKPEELKPLQQTASDYAMHASNPADKILHPVGQWNTTRIIFTPEKVEYWLNGKMTVSFVPWSEDWYERKNSDKWKNSKDYGKYKTGFIGFQDHSSPIWFRNIKIKKL